MKRFISLVARLGTVTAAFLITVATAQLGPVRAQALPTAPPIPPQDCGGEANGNATLNANLQQILGPSRPNWARATVVVFPYGNPSGLSYIQSVQAIIAPIPTGSPAPNAEASAQAMANLNTGLTTAIHFASIHNNPGQPYDGGFHCTGLASGQYTVLVTLYRVPSQTQMNNYAATYKSQYGIDFSAGSLAGFTPTYFYELPRVNVRSGPIPGNYPTTISSGNFQELGSHPAGF